MSLKYHAFISYRHADNKEQGRQWATWLHQAIETYEVPSDLVGKKNGRGEEIPARIYPIFRDEEELPADADLGGAITRALDETRLLIVLCSPRAVASTYVADEIDYFKKLGHSDKIIAAMIDGEPNTSWDKGKLDLGFKVEDECFPIPLQFEYDEAGKPTNKYAEPIAADFRINNDGIPEQGWTSVEAYRHYLRSSSKLDKKSIENKVTKYHQQQHLMLLKIIAGVLGVPLGELTQRDKEYQLEQARLKANRLRRWLAAVGLLAVIAVAAGIFAYIQMQKATNERDKVIAVLVEVKKNLNFMNFDMRDALETYAPLAVQLELDTQIDGLLTILSTYSGDDDDTDLDSATVMIHKANVLLDDVNTNSADVLEIVNKAHQIFYELNISEPENELHKRNLAVSKLLISKIYTRQREFDRALTFSDLAREIIEELILASSDDMGLYSDLADIYSQQGDVYSTSESPQDALLSYRKSLDYRQYIAENDPDNLIRQNDIASSYYRIAGVYILLDELDYAEENYLLALKIREYLVKQYPNNSGWLNDLSAVQSNLATTYLRKEELEIALTHYKSALEIGEKLVFHDPDNLSWHINYSKSLSSIGDLHQKMDNLDDAFQYYQQALNFGYTILGQDENISWQNFLLELETKVAPTFLQAEYLEDAINVYKKAIQRNKYLISIIRNDEDLYNNILDLIYRLSKVNLADSKLDEAYQLRLSAVDIAEKALLEIPEIENIQRNLMVVYYQLYYIQQLVGEDQNSLKSLNKAIQVLQQMEQIYGLDEEDKKLLEMMNDIIDQP